jgi:hypothetical protein
MHHNAILWTMNLPSNFLSGIKLAFCTSQCSDFLFFFGFSDVVQVTSNYLGIVG